jgi:hypothetical protein
MTSLSRSGTAQVSSPLVRQVLTNPGADCIINLDTVLAYYQ